MGKANSSNRIIAIVAMLAMVLLMQFSNIYISEHANHHCTEPDSCPVCTMIVQCQSNLKTLGSGLILVVIAVMAIKAVLVEATNFDYQSIQTTLVSQKVRLDS